MSNYLTDCNCPSCTAGRKAEEERKAAMPQRVLNVTDILKGGPCETYRNRLFDRFQTTIVVTVELAEAQAKDWDWYWAAERLLTRDGWDKFQAGSEDVERNMYKPLKPYNNLLNEAYEEADRLSVAKRLEVFDAGGTNEDAYREANKVYRSAIKVASAAVEAARKVLDEGYYKALARLFAEIFISEKDSTEPTGNDKYRCDEDESYYEEY